jgi:hypothetical protein
VFRLYTNITPFYLKDFYKNSTIADFGMGEACPGTRPL